MKSIALKNFRRFNDMNSITLGGVNMFVGGNNAGKSTVVKALLLVAEFLKNTKITGNSLFSNPRFYFDGFDGHSVNIDLFYRALYRDCPKEDKSMTFNVIIGHFAIELCIFDITNEEFIPYGEIKYIKVEDLNEKITFNFQIDAARMSVSFDSEEPEMDIDSLNNQRTSIMQKIQDITEQIESLAKSQGSDNNALNQQLLIDLADSNKVLADLENKIALLSKESAMSNTFEIELVQSLSSMGGYISSLILGFVEFSSIKSKTDTKENRRIKDELKPSIPIFEKIARELDFTFGQINLEYLSAHSAEQQVHYNKKDGNDYVARSIHEFNKLRIANSSLEGELLITWLKAFNCADDYKISTNDGETYWFDLLIKGKQVHLGDMGRGTIQLVVMFIRLATIIKKYKGKTIKPIVLVEEPEQNLHPAVQFQLTSLFYEIYQKYGIRFIIETHSEYMIWQVQIEMAKYFKNNPIETAPIRSFYFPSSGKPYDMGFQKNGKFVKPIEEGFFNIQSKAAITLLEMED